MPRRPILTCLLAAVMAPASALAEVTSVTEGSFTSVHEQRLALPPDAAWKLLTEGLSSWWDADHSYGAVAENLSLEPGPGGCLCEKLEGGGWVEHLRVIFVQPPGTLKMQGALGPLVDMGLQGVMRWNLEATEDGGSLFTSTYVVSGHLEGGFQNLAPVVDAVNGGHFVRLERVARGLPPTE